MSSIKNRLIKILSKRESENNRLEDFFFISAFPKSGSSFISLVLTDLLDLPIVDIVYSHFREQDIYLPKIEAYQNIKTISKHHTLATTPNLELLSKFNVSPVILIRSLPDTIISLRDHISKTLRWPHFQVPKDFDKWESDVQFDFLIDVAIPWYIFFYTSWKKVEKENVIKIKFVKYENFNAKPAEAIKDITEFIGFEIEIKQIEESMKKVKLLSKDKNRINKGVVNRGDTLLSEVQKEKIASFAKYYPDIDFESIL